ncbi:hypothetical protein F0U60_51125 [Archangium minus]|uniref:Uncharacterized protein n=1 Tax=Archangium minus TaxID=83450 RepID=A0ABY9X842_9BACT|nr:hypothetical protein F0U60_51125 [Archangium minus]
MQFTLSDHGLPPPPTQWGLFLFISILLAVFALLIGPPLLLWLRRSSGNTLDVLRITPTSALPVSTFQRLLELMGWLLPTLGLFIFLVVTLAGSYSALLIETERNFYIPVRWDSEEEPVNPVWGTLFLVGLVGFYVFMLSMQRPSSTHDVLRVGRSVGRARRSHRLVRATL